MSERWRPKKLIRERVEHIAKFGVVPETPISFNPTPPADVRQVGKGSIRITLCRHDLPWRDCTICSQARRT